MHTHRRDGDRNAELLNAIKSFADRRVTGDPPCSSPRRRAASTQIRARAHAQVIDLRFDKEIVPHGIAGFEVLQLHAFQRSLLCELMR
jgi:hypothetical protein